MATLKDRPNTALLVIDVQQGVVEGGHERDAVVANIAEVIERARAAGVQVVWVQHSDDNLPRGSDAWQIVSELQPKDDEEVVAKHFGDLRGDCARVCSSTRQSAGSSWSVRRRTPASERRCTVDWCEGTT